MFLSIKSFIRKANTAEDRNKLPSSKSFFNNKQKINEISINEHVRNDLQLNVFAAEKVLETATQYFYTEAKETLRALIEVKLPLPFPTEIDQLQIRKARITTTLKIVECINQQRPVLDLSQEIYDIQYIPEVVFDMLAPFLTELNLSNNRFKSIPKGVNKLTKLIKLDLSTNLITNLDEEEISHLINLQSFDISFNQISVVPASANLTSVNFSHNKINQFDYNLSQNLSLNSLNLSNNLIQSIPEDLFAKSNIMELDLSANFISSLAEISLPANLKVLKLNDNKLTNIPDSISNNNTLKELDLRLNQFSGHRCAELETICSKNRIKIIFSSRKVNTISVPNTIEI